MGECKVHIGLEVNFVIDLFSDLIRVMDNSLSVRDHLELMAKRMLSGYSNRHEGIKFLVESAGMNYAEIYDSAFTLDDAKFCVAKGYGYESWTEVEREQKTPDLDFESLIDRMLKGDLDTLKKAVEKKPDIVHQSSVYPHRATLLHYTGSNGVEAYRQVVPLNLVEIVDFLLSSGADPTLEANIYGGCTARDLLETSKHPYESGVIKDVLAVYERYEAV
ncbi:hypothetical protein MJD09_08885 [bacterium]|nr:hypothetical protein [bacterium]